MSTFPQSPRLLKGGIVLIDPASSAVRRIIALQYNPDSISRTLQAKGVSGEGEDRSEALRLKGPPVETIKVEIEIDAADQLANGDATAQGGGSYPQLSALEMLVYPKSALVIANTVLMAVGTIEVLPPSAPLTIF